MVFLNMIELLLFRQYKKVRMAHEGQPALTVVQLLVFANVFRLIPLQILDWFVQICLAIKHIHDRKILHRDIKTQVRL